MKNAIGSIVNITRKNILLLVLVLAVSGLGIAAWQTNAQKETGAVTGGNEQISPNNDTPNQNAKSSDPALPNYDIRTAKGEGVNDFFVAARARSGKTAVDVVSL